MKMSIALGLAMAALTVPASVQYNNYGSGSNQNNHYVQPHTQSNGTYVGGHYQTNPNATQRDNYGATGNTNPYTGQMMGGGAGAAPAPQAGPEAVRLGSVSGQVAVELAPQEHSARLRQA